MTISNIRQQAEPDRSTRISSWPGWLPLLVFPATTICFRDRLPAWMFMWSLAFSIFAGLKWMTWWKARKRVTHTASRSLAYLVGWPGMDAETFLDSQQHRSAPQFRQWMWSLLKTASGIALLWLVARRIPARLPLAQGWLGLFGLVLLLHFGTFDLIALFWQRIGIAAQPIMDKPTLSTTLSEFWGKRWNLGFRQLAYDLIFRPLHKKIGPGPASLLVFLASGLIHDLVISLPARGGYGLPTAYFIFQGLAVMLERSAAGRRFGLDHGLSGWVFMFVVAAGPAFWLFHPPFVLRVILPFMHAIRAL